MKPVILEVRNVTKAFGGLIAVKDVSLTQYQGEILGLIGPNGAGKTTLFNVINGVYKPTSGEVIFDGQKISGLPPFEVVRRGLARTHQIVKPLNEMTVLENVTVGACFGPQNLPLDAAQEVAAEVIEFIGLAEYADVLAGKLNIALKKRLEVARALAAKPRLLLLDEVLAGLNPSEVAKMLDVIRAIRDQGISILMIEHIMQAIMSLSDRIVVLNFGEKLAEGSPDEVANDPQVIEAYLGDPEMAKRILEEEEA
ncbi:ABC transporter ATP-binding protein [Oceanithermus sp.]|uniref:ABC transporter ATP-binding protein n=1 Tax=Oceanithermus sp. TaxID=2268145 RepID=UPI002600FBDF|nr:ABC transporter ATP-binding protein [Oceanithermus sp.]